jgi:RimJ/RimL family protein N-acetyltransferase
MSYETQNAVYEGVCFENDERVTRKVYPLIFSAENLKKFWDKARQFPQIYWKEALSEQDFLNMFLQLQNDGTYAATGMVWVVDDFTGVFYVTNIDGTNDALVHYTFFDRKHNGRLHFVKGMVKHVFEKYQFHRLSAEIPNYATPQVRRFAEQLGFIYEGKRRKAARYKGDWFDVNLYGILRQEALRGSAEN